MSGYEVRWSDTALAAIGAHLARTSPGVVQLQPILMRQVLAGARDAVAGRTGRTADTAAVTVARDADGLEVSVRIVTRLVPPPVVVLRTLGQTLVREIGRVTGQPVRAAVTISDVLP